jgi:hypothetical protein
MAPLAHVRADIYARRRGVAMAVHRAVLRELNSKVGGAVVRDAETGDWLVIMSPRVVTAEDRYRVFNALMSQLDEWDRHGHSTDEVRSYLCATR